MKKILFTITLLLLLPKCYAVSGTTSYDYIDVTVNDNGSITIKEYYSLEGEYNGSYRDLNYIGAINEFKGDRDSFNGSDIYNGSSITNINVYDTKKDNNLTLNEKFISNPYANVGDYGVYQLSPNSKGIRVKIFNPSNYNTGFYIEYTVDDVVIVHNDIAEIGWNFFGKDYYENTKNLIITFHLPEKNENLRAWLHGPLDGQIELMNNYTVRATYDYLNSNTPIDVRLVFDKAVVPKATKVSGVNAFDNILEVEQERVDKTNAIIQRYKVYINIVKILTYLWYVGLIALVINVYRKYDKEYKTNFNHKYYREFPDIYGPEVVEYLFKKKITPQGVSASLLELIRKKHFIIEMIDKKDYKLVKNNINDNDLTESEKYLKIWFLNEIGNGESVSTKDIRSASNTTIKAKDFLKSYNKWQDIVIKDAENKEFFEDNINVKIKVSIYNIIGAIIIFILNVTVITNHFLGYFVFIPAIIATIYCISFTRRTIKGNEHYQQWRTFKNFLLDFGRFSEKKLPEIHLWERYLVYATVLGIATKLSKTMKIKLENMNVSSDITSRYMLLHYNNTLVGHTLTSSINNSINKTLSNAVNNSRPASGSGFGGGASIGGGGFGGGGGGGRF